MPLPNIYYPPPGKEGWQTFWFNVFIDHQDIQQAVNKQLGVNDPIYPILPWVEENANNLLELHQEFHNDMNGALGLASQDLSTIDFKDPASVQSWCYNHYQEHAAAHSALGI